MNTRWLWINGEAQGPYSVEEIGRLRAAGIANARTLHSDGSEWVPLGDFGQYVEPEASSVGGADTTIKVALVTVLMILAIAVVGAQLANVSTGLAKRRAVNEAREAVLNQLVSPGSAKFAERLRARPAFAHEIGEWVIEGSVDSQNKFGALVRSDFIVET